MYILVPKYENVEYLWSNAITFRQNGGTVPGADTNSGESFMQIGVIRTSWYCLPSAFVTTNTTVFPGTPSPAGK